MFTNPTAPNIGDFFAFVLNQGVPSADLPSGTLTTVTVDTLGNLTAASTTGTVAAGMALVGNGLNTYIATWTGTSGTVSPAPTAPVSIASASTYSQYLAWAFGAAVAITLAPPPGMPAIEYVMAVYNYGMHKLLKVGQDQAEQTFFADQRAAFKLLSFKAGPIGASADQATSQTLVTPDFLKGLTMGDLDLLLTPWGREYLDYSQASGPSIVGVS